MLLEPVAEITERSAQSRSVGRSLARGQAPMQDKAVEDKVLCQFAWTRLGLSQFVRNVERHLAEGWRIRRFACTSGLLGVRWLCRAILSRHVGLMPRRSPAAPRRSPIRQTSP